MNQTDRASQIHMLDISAMIMGKVDTIHPTLIHDDKHAILVDTGFPGQTPLFTQAMESHGIRIHDLSHVILTHQDIDHIGSLPAMLEQTEHLIEVLASEKEKPFIEGDQMILKITPEALAAAEAMIPANVPEQWKQAFLSTLKNPPKSPVNRVIQDGEVLPLCGGIEVIATPGHTPGHISLYHIPSKTLIAADALRVVDGRLYGPSPEQTLNMPQAMESVKKLASYEVQSVICYHGGLFQDNVSQALQELAHI
ncbi:MBL fold metallo-hydrolase [Paenibacillus sp. KQZ6P-2]|uniref:MBL fold metallo-hydrolase n=1 Tax=Paenibacillus mangrovi TaxID=2931978 RepID=A0A9X1WL18_9BACL|nr:MBL fold metallo-hydrolase [Paenibacillus mangrovi]MCJ8010913.1 MBL fold metallo-hydrolase [Paenibacillus mangrovi]